MMMWIVRVGLGMSTGLEISKLIGVSISKTEIRLSVSKLSKSKLMLLCK